jgi:hypothetical protein
MLAAMRTLFEYRMHANECPAERTAISGANPDNGHRHRQAYPKGGGNRRRECEQQVFFGLYLFEFRHGLLHQSESQKAVTGMKRQTAFWLTHTVSRSPQAKGCLNMVNKVLIAVMS